MRVLMGLCVVLLATGLALATPGNGNGNGNGNGRGNGAGGSPGRNTGPRGRCDPTGADAPFIAAAQADIAANCDCAGAADHGDFVTCAVAATKQDVPKRSCWGKVISCAAESTCGIPGAVLCCTADAGGSLECEVIEGGCVACVAPDGGSACCTDPSLGGPTSCCGSSGVAKGQACGEATCVLQ